MLAIIGGTGLYQLPWIELLGEEAVSTPFGAPSSAVIRASYGGQRVLFLPRHGKHHHLLPSEINYRANIWALKRLGATRIVSVSAVGSLDEKFPPGSLVTPDQYLDFTKGRRPPTFFGEGVVAHIASAEPVCSRLSAGLRNVSKGTSAPILGPAAYACVEGPRLGTRAESFFLRSTNAQLVGMTAVPECFLAREAQLCYAQICVVTDFDSWMEDPTSHVTAALVLSLYRQNLSKVEAILKAAITSLDDSAFTGCRCRSALQGALMTPMEHIPQSRQEALSLLLK